MRLTRRQPPHARARALPETNRASALPQPDSTENSEEPKFFHDTITAEKCFQRYYLLLLGTTLGHDRMIRDA